MRTAGDLSHRRAGGFDKLLSVAADGRDGAAFFSAVRFPMESKSMKVDGLQRFVRLSVLAAVFGLSLSGVVHAGDSEVVMYKDANCGCCGKWAEHMRENGFTVREVASRAMGEIKRDAGVSAKLASCHTARVGGYVVEGHVPAVDVKRLLQERPDVAGIAVPGMPLGSPGMEGPYSAQSYEVVAFDADGQTTVFASH